MTKLMHRAPLLSLACAFDAESINQLMPVDTGLEVESNKYSGFHPNFEDIATERVR